MKLAVVGKGGVGKSAIAAGLAWQLVQRGQKVLAIDADPDQNLGPSLGLPLDRMPAPIAELGTLVDERVGGAGGGLFRLNPQVDDIPERYATLHSGVRLMIMGTVQEAGGGCLCRPNTLVKALLRHLLLERDEHVVVDMVAGVEHLGRGTAGGVDVLVVVVEPQERSILTAKHMHELANGLCVKRICFVANKVRSAGDRQFVEARLAPHLLTASIAFSARFLDHTVPVQNSEFLVACDNLISALLAPPPEPA